MANFTGFIIGVNDNRLYVEKKTDYATILIGDLESQSPEGGGQCIEIEMEHLPDVINALLSLVISES